MAQTSITINTSLGYAGGLADIGFHEIGSGVNADTVTIPGGVMVCLLSTASVAQPAQFVLPTVTFSMTNTGAGLPAGITVHTQALDTIGLQTEVAGAHISAYNLGLFKVGREMAVLRKGRILVTPESAVVAGDPVFGRFTVNTGSGQGQLGSFSNATDSGKNVQVWGARFETSSDSVTGVAQLSYDLNAHLAGILSA